ncbi:hypothetical protein D9615_005227 [Tricholomella constricta]|uniref:F-box domain-containing protein n=1 Tax=Tricholomella constricta TaxID=117010 RepID=A0A8H5M198_9AGAR|nr:hypothetical protein D9615_005227 [Tricholomella constricta]
MALSPLPARSRFIDDLVPLILESNDHWWPRDLLRLAQVSSAWLGPVRRRLFALPSLHSFHACSQLARTLSGNPKLLSLVKGIELRPALEDSPNGRLISAEDRANLRFILALEGLQHITLGGLLAVKAERLLHTVGDAQSVLDLHIDGSLLAHSLSFRPSLEWDESIAFRFSNLQTLRLTNLELDIPYPVIPYQLQLSKLHLDNVVVMSGYISHLLHETPSLHHLCIRSKRASEFDEQIRLILESCAIDTLEYEVETDGHSHHLIFTDDSPPFSSLRCLRFTGIHVDLDILDSISQKCQNLEDLTVSGRMVTILPCEWVSFITKRHLARLRSLGLPWGTNNPPFVRWCSSAGEAVLKAAATYDIRVLPERLKY